MLLTAQLWRELTDLGVLEGDEACALCRQRPQILLDAARAPLLLCPVHARSLADQLIADLERVVLTENSN